ncbi:DNA repair photolyase [Motilibacter peucedani]|uniref:DNA repair photolyase n=1 Tax=Motilibacter peucedani TaxID=598650 RepID=A0A420XSW1_9ACTN|nr:Rv2578c family radical SAM protein [Motilibacter peucedani]RKS77907.1 DNA repair photolyase [Motilibacter peucedani]
MRWDAQRVDAGAVEDAAGDGALLPVGAVTRTFDTPEFRGMTFFEVHARSALNSVPAASAVPFRWTVNPYRGCSHACRYCFARKTHEYLELDSGADFDSKVVVKVNVADVLARELRRPSWRGEHVALGTNTDPYQRVEGRYGLTRQVLERLRDARNPFSILTKSALVLRDLDVLRSAAEVTDVSVALSVGFVDRELWRTVEPGTPPPSRRLEAVAALREAGIPCGVLMAPVLPWLSDSPAQLGATVAAVAEAGADYVTPLALHLRPGAREWYLRWLAEAHPDLVPRYREMYAAGSYAPRDYTARINAQVRELAARHGVGRRVTTTWRTGHERAARHERAALPRTPPAQQLPLL